jgi:hypothetical protein
MEIRAPLAVTSEFPPMESLINKSVGATVFEDVVPSSIEYSVFALPPRSFAITLRVINPVSSLTVKMSSVACGVLSKEFVVPKMLSLVPAQPG